MNTPVLQRFGYDGVFCATLVCVGGYGRPDPTFQRQPHN